MAKILVVESSARRDESVSRMLVREFVDQLRQRNGIHEFIWRDLARNPVPVMNEHIVGAIRTQFSELDLEGRQLTALSEELIAEIKSADYVVIGAPMYNWGIPAALKAWVDQVVRRGLTFDYGAGGVIGLLAGKPALVVAVRGGNYSLPERAPMDMQKPYLAQILGLIGMDVRFAVMDGTALPEDQREAGLTVAREALRREAENFDASLATR